MKQIDSLIIKINFMWEGNFQPKYLIIANIIKLAQLDNDNGSFINPWWLIFFFIILLVMIPSQIWILQCSFTFW